MKFDEPCNCRYLAYTIFIMSAIAVLLYLLGKQDGREDFYRQCNTYSMEAKTISYTVCDEIFDRNVASDDK